jgi:hypothetical protein
MSLVVKNGSKYAPVFPESCRNRYPQCSGRYNGRATRQGAFGNSWSMTCSFKSIVNSHAARHRIARIGPPDGPLPDPVAWIDFTNPVPGRGIMRSGCRFRLFF